MSKRRKRDIIKNTPEYKNWRIAILEKDEYTCQRCLEQQRNKLQVHHIYNFSEHSHLRTNIDNGIILCIKCHSPYYKGSFHDIYGTHNNTLEQLAEYINKYKLEEK